jgi:hypothetical protein
MIGRIYKLEGGGRFYIGSTTCLLNKRFSKHKSKSKEKNSENRPVYVYFKNIGWDNVTISLIEEFTVSSRQELLHRENDEIKKYMGQPEVLNSNRCIILPEEKKQRDKEYSKNRRIKNPEHERNRLQQWRILNPEKRKAQYMRDNQKNKNTTTQ